MGETYKAEIIAAIPEGEEIRLYSQGEWLDLCRGPHVPSTGKVGKGFKLHEGRRRLLARRFATSRCSSASTARPGPSEKELKAYLHRLEEAEKRDHRRIGTRAGPVPFPGRGAGRGVLASEGLGAVPGADRLHAPAPAAPPAIGEVNAPEIMDAHAVGAVRPSGRSSARTCSSTEDAGRARLLLSSR